MRLGKVAAILASVVALLAAAPVPQAGKPGSPAASLVPPSPVGAAPPIAGAPVHVLDAADLSAWLDGMVPYSLKAGNIAGVVIVVVKDGRVLAEKGYGYADVAAKRPMDPERTLIRPGSTSKLFTWTAVMQQVQAGRIDLDRDVNAYLDFRIPEPFGRPVTMRDLMNHRAGFEEGLKDILTTDPARAQSTESYLKTHPRPMLFAPGSVPAYSNYGASLAGYIVQRVSGEPFERYVDNHIFRPLGMNHATFDQPLPPRFRADVAKGYMTATDAPFPYELIVTRPAGSMTVTAADMAKFMLAHLGQGGAILNPATTQLMHAPSEAGLPGFATMAHGFFYGTQNGRLVIGHGGDTVVFHSELDLLPSEGVGIFYSYNSRGENNAVYGARKALFDGFMDRYFPAPPAVAGPAPAPATARADAAAIAGRYQSSRRVEHGFLSALYLLSQTVITANPDGTITGPGGPGEPPATFREVAPRMWQVVGGTRRLALRTVGGVKTVIDSEDPITVLQPASFWRSAPLTLTLLGAALAVLLSTLILWPVAPLLRRADRAVSGVPAEVRRARLVDRVAVLVAVLYLFGWYLLIKPVLSSQLQVYGPQLDGAVRALQLAGLLLIAAAAAGLWAAWQLFRARGPWPARVWGVLVALALLALVWIAAIGQLLSWNLNY